MVNEVKNKEYLVHFSDDGKLVFKEEDGVEYVLDCASHAMYAVKRKFDPEHPDANREGWVELAEEDRMVMSECDFGELVENLDERHQLELQEEGITW